MKLLLYCTKSKPYLYQGFARPMHTLDTHNPFNYKWRCLLKTKTSAALNGKIAVECDDYEVEEITTRWGEFETKKYSEFALQELSCLTHQELCTYFGKLRNMGRGSKHCGYAIKIKNLKIFDEPQWLMDFFVKKRTNNVEVDDIVLNGVLYTPVRKAPQNMMIVYDRFGNKYVLISIHPEWLCKKLNGEKKN